MNTTELPSGPVERIVSLHTPGPWAVDIDLWHYGIASTVVAGSERNTFPFRDLLVQVGGTDVERQEANTRLIAAAPDLLRLLGLMFDAYENGVDCFEDPEDCASYVGKAFRLPDREFKEIADLLNKLEDAKTLGVPANTK